MKHPWVLGRGRVAGLVGVLLAAAFVVVLGPAATPARAETSEFPFIVFRNSSDPELQRCSDPATGWSGLCLFTSSDLGTHGPSFDHYYPMEATYLYTYDNVNPGYWPNWQDRGAIFTEGQIPWAARYPDGTLAQHLWAPTYAYFQGYHYLFVPDIADVTQVHTSSRIAVARSSSLFGGYTYLGAYDLGEYASAPAIFFRPESELEPAPVPYLVYSDGDGDTCGGLKIAQLDYRDLTNAGTAQPITIHGLADWFGTSGPGCAEKGRPYLDGASLYWFSPTETGGTSGEDYYLIFAVKPEGGLHGASNQVVAYATAANVWGPYHYRGVIVEGSSTEFSNNASIQKYLGHYILAYHDGTTVNGLPARRVRAACLTFQGGLINPIERTADGLLRCHEIRNKVALRSRGTGTVVTAENAGASDLVANRAHIGLWEKFTIYPRAGGRIALRADANGMYVSANHPLAALRADASTVGAHEEFALAFQPDGSVTLSGPSGGPVAPTTSGATLVDSWTAQTQTLGGGFDIVPLSGSYALRSLANSRFVTAPDGPNSALVATGDSGSAPGWRDMFFFTHQPDGWGHVALRWEAHNQYVCAESAGTQPLIANRSDAQWWEMFLLMWNTDGTFSLRAAVNGKHVSVPSGGGPLIADQPQISPSEKFDLVGTLGTTW